MISFSSHYNLSEKFYQLLSSIDSALKNHHFVGWWFFNKKADHNDRPLIYMIEFFLFTLPVLQLSPDSIL
ncbi:MAG: hypothetical protein PWQ77_2018 [Kosmotogales bacterium]|nr:hypothetical protein [Kosmotogales bacterium]